MTTNPDDIFIGESATELAAVDCESQIKFDQSFYELILEQNPYNMLVLRRLVEILARAENYGQSLQLGLRLAKLCPADCIVYYNLACSYSMLGQISEGLHMLEEAMRIGYADLAHMDADTDLDTLRTDPRYDGILARAVASFV